MRPRTACAIITPSAPLSLWTQSPVTSLRPEADRPALRRPAWAARGLAIVAWLAALACRPRSRAQTATEVQVTPETMTLGVGQKQPIFAAAYDRQGNLISSAKFTFWSSDTAIARVSRERHGAGRRPRARQGRGAAPGQARVARRADHRRRRRSGAAPALGAHARSRPRRCCCPGESVLITPQALREDGTPLPLGRVIWKSLKPEVATVDSTGLVVGVDSGQEHRAGQRRERGSWPRCRSRSSRRRSRWPAPARSSGPRRRRRCACGCPRRATARSRPASNGARPIPPSRRWDRAASCRRGQPGRTEIVRARASARSGGSSLTVHRLPQTLVVTPKPVRRGDPGAAPRDAAVHAPWPRRRTPRPFPRRASRGRWATRAGAGFDRATGTLTARDTGATTLTARLRGFEPVVWRLQVVPGVLGLDRARAGLRPGERTTLGRQPARRRRARSIGPAAGVEWTQRPARGRGGERRRGPGGEPGPRGRRPRRRPWGKAATADVFVTADLLVASNRSGAFGLYQLRSGEPRHACCRCWSTAAATSRAVRSPDRTRIAYSSNRGGSYDLYVMDADGRNARRLTTDPGSEGEPVWTPDGTAHHLHRDAAPAACRSS